MSTNQNYDYNPNYGLDKKQYGRVCIATPVYQNYDMRATSYLPCYQHRQSKTKQTSIHLLFIVLGIYVLFWACWTYCFRHVWRVSGLKHSCRPKFYLKF